MATKTYVPSMPVPGVSKYFWETITESDTAAAALPGGTEPAIGSIQVTGDFGGATVVLQGSNDNSNWVTIQDIEGNDISFTAAGAVDFSTGMLYIRPSASGGSSQDVDISMVLRG